MNKTPARTHNHTCVRRLMNQLCALLKFHHLEIYIRATRWSIKRKMIAFNCNSCLLIRVVDGIMKSSSASSRSTRAPACWASLSPGSCWGRPPVSFCHCRGHCNVPWRQWKRRATLPREHDTMTFITNHCGLLVFICMRLCKGSMFCFVFNTWTMLIHAAGRFVLKPSIGEKKDLWQKCVWNWGIGGWGTAGTFSICANLQITGSFATFSCCIHEKLQEMSILFEQNVPACDIFWAIVGPGLIPSVCAALQVCWKGERPYCLLSAFKSRFSSSYLVQPLLYCRCSCAINPFSIGINPHQVKVFCLAGT